MWEPREPSVVPGVAPPRARARGWRGAAGPGRLRPPGSGAGRALRAGARPASLDAPSRAPRYGMCTLVQLPHPFPRRARAVTPVTHRVLIITVFDLSAFLLAPTHWRQLVDDTQAAADVAAAASSASARRARALAMGTVSGAGGGSAVWGAGHAGACLRSRRDWAATVPQHGAGGPGHGLKTALKGLS